MNIVGKKIVVGLLSLLIVIVGVMILTGDRVSNTYDSKVFTEVENDLVAFYESYLDYVNDEGTYNPSGIVEEFFILTIWTSMRIS